MQPHAQNNAAINSIMNLPFLRALMRRNRLQ
jgi:hypothetical protein